MIRQMEVAEQTHVLDRHVRPDLQLTRRLEEYEVVVKQEAGIAQHREMLGNLPHERINVDGDQLVDGQMEKAIDRLVSKSTKMAT